MLAEASYVFSSQQYNVVWGVFNNFNCSFFVFICVQDDMRCMNQLKSSHQITKLEPSRIRPTNAALHRLVLQQELCDTSSRLYSVNSALSRPSILPCSLMLQQTLSSQLPLPNSHFHIHWFYCILQVNFSFFFFFYIFFHFKLWG